MWCDTSSLNVIGFCSQASSASDQRHFLERCVDEYHLAAAAIEPDPPLSSFPIPASSAAVGRARTRSRSRSSSRDVSVEVRTGDVGEKVAATVALGSAKKELCSCKRRHASALLDSGSAACSHNRSSSIIGSVSGIGIGAEPPLVCRKVPELFYRSEMSPSPQAVEVRVIDHAHSVPSAVPDQSYLYGIRSLIGALEGIVVEVCGSREGMGGHREPCLDIGPALEAGFIK
jgi:hypothetical protein